MFRVCETMLWINFKNYKNTFGDGALKLAKTCHQVAQETGVKIIPVVSALDLREIKEKVGGEIWLQHTDLFFEGKSTGWVSPLAAVLAGADGTLLNHSEHKIPFGKIRQILAYLKKDSWVKHWSSELKNDQWKTLNDKFKTMVCVKTKGQAERKVKKLSPKPNFVAYEPPELIGGEVSVAESKPEVVKRIIELLPDHQIIIGAGIKTAMDIKKSLQLGAKGVLLSSGVVKADDPKKKLVELAMAFTDKIKPACRTGRSQKSKVKNANQK